jgi:hypothetical protein
MALSDVCTLTGLSWPTVKQIVKDDLTRRAKKVDLRHVRYIAIDEVSHKKGQQYFTVVLDWESGEVLHVGDGRGMESLKEFFWKLRCSRAKLAAVAMDMHEPYAAAVKEYYRKPVDIVYDRFHVMKLVSKQLDEVRRQEMARADSDGSMRYIKGQRYVLLRPLEDLSLDGQQRLEKLLQVNRNICMAYILKEDLRSFWEADSMEEGATLLLTWICQAMSTGQDPPPAPGSGRILSPGRPKAGFRRPKTGFWSLRDVTLLLVEVPSALNSGFRERAKPGAPPCPPLRTVLGPILGWGWFRESLQLFSGADQHLQPTGDTDLHVVGSTHQAPRDVDDVEPDRLEPLLDPAFAEHQSLHRRVEVEREDHAPPPRRIFPEVPRGKPAPGEIPFHHRVSFLTLAAPLVESADHLIAGPGRGFAALGLLPLPIDLLVDLVRRPLEVRHDSEHLVSQAIPVHRLEW